MTEFSRWCHAGEADPPFGRRPPPDPAVDVRLGDCHAVVGWDRSAHSYVAAVDVFGLVGADGFRHYRLPATMADPAWDWMRAHSHRAGPPLLVLGGRPWQHLTLDSLLNDLGRRALDPDCRSWYRMLDLRQLVAERVGEVVLRSATSGGPGSDGCYRLEVQLPGGERLVVPPRLIRLDSGQSTPWRGFGILELAERVVELVWGRGDEDGGILAWELAYEVLDGRDGFAVIASSVADWIAHGSGLRWLGEIDGGPVVGGQGSSFQQMVLAV
jgi:hypothetical protein